VASGGTETFDIGFGPYNLTPERHASDIVITFDTPRSWGVANDPEHHINDPPDRSVYTEEFYTEIYGDDRFEDAYPLEYGALDVIVQAPQFVEFPDNLTVIIWAQNPGGSDVILHSMVELESTIKEPDPVIIGSNNTTIIAVVFEAHEVDYGYNRHLQIETWLEGGSDVGYSSFHIDVLASSFRPFRMAGTYGRFLNFETTIKVKLNIENELKIYGTCKNFGISDKTAWINVSLTDMKSGLPYILSSGPLNIPQGGTTPVTLTISPDRLGSGKGVIQFQLQSEGKAEAQEAQFDGWKGDPTVLEGLELYAQITGGAYLSFFVMFVALIYSGPMFSEELENKTLPMLVTRPLRKIEILIYKFLGYILSTSILIVIPIFLLYGIVGYKIGGGPAIENITIPFAFAFASFLGIVTFGSIFTFIGILTKHPLMFSTFYLLIWEVSQHLTSSLIGGDICGICGLGMLQKGTVTHYTKSVANDLIVDKIPNSPDLLGLSVYSFSSNLDRLVTVSIATPIGYAVLVILAVSLIFLILSHVVFSMKDIN
jgi:ABC-type transport system involved in multi-copper enzyme maturation permease subunit